MNSLQGASTDEPVSFSRKDRSVSYCHWNYVMQTGVCEASVDGKGADVCGIYADSKGTDQTVHLHSLISAFAACLQNHWMLRMY